MSDVFAKRRPIIDWDEFERRLCRPCSADQRDGEPLAELLRVIGGKDESHETDFEPNIPLSARAWQDAGEPGELDQPDAQVRLVGGDFAAIEAGLLGTKQPQERFRRKPSGQRSSTKGQPRQHLLSAAISLRSKPDCWAHRENKPRRRFQKPTCQTLFRAWTSDRNVPSIRTTSRFPHTPASPTGKTDHGARSMSWLRSSSWQWQA